MELVSILFYRVMLLKQFLVLREVPRAPVLYLVLLNG